jgi:hypothetical protein
MIRPQRSRYSGLIVQGDFVIQLRKESDPPSGQFCGRIEHIDTGRSSAFHSLEELGAIILQLLSAVETHQQ